MKNEIIWEWCQYRVLRRADIGPDAALLIETRTHDALGGESWRETPDGEAGMVIERLAVELHDRVKKAEAGRERFREVVEAKLPEYVPSSNHDAAASLSRPHTHAYSRIDRELMPNEHEDPRVAEERRLVGLESHLASLRAELTALGKHVEDVERRAYDTPTKAAFGDCLNKTLEVEQRIRLGEEMAKRIDQKLDTRANAISIDYYAMRARIDALEENRPSPKPDNLGMTYAERLALASAGKAETLEAVRSLTDALQALEGRLADVEASVGQPGPLDALENRVERLEGHIEHRAWTAITQRVEALEMKVDDLAAGWGSCGPARPDEKREAVIREHEAGYREAPLDLATLRVSGQATGASETAVSFRPAGHALDIVTEVRVLPGYGSEERHEWVTVGPSEARLLARALTQWADEKEAKPGPSPRAYEPDSEDGS